jgi:hypothetical protein
MKYDGTDEDSSFFVYFDDLLGLGSILSCFTSSMGSIGSMMGFGFGKGLECSNAS